MSARNGGTPGIKLTNGEVQVTLRYMLGVPKAVFLHIVLCRLILHLRVNNTSPSAAMNPTASDGVEISWNQNSFTANRNRAHELEEIRFATRVVRDISTKGLSGNLGTWPPWIGMVMYGAFCKRELFYLQHLVCEGLESSRPWKTVVQPVPEIPGIVAMGAILRLEMFPAAALVTDTEGRG
ncbi:hypothetical protein CC2G_009834 [Coprinopsis cinerea AmutBmut pab1-1]|nr:hypothetical protein CC2G_009834 [Coprinopsis cinerea AmutBmut pab1-1]